MPIVEKLKQLQPDMAKWRHDIHAHPELGYEEHRTGEVVAKKLESFGLPVHRGLGRTGVVGTLSSGSGKRSIGLRADMDALPIHEKNGFDYRSQNEGKMHACGHDGHTTMLLGAAKCLADTKNFDGTVHFIFQPAEEGGGGGKAMIDDGLFEKFPVESVYGMHNWPGMPVGQFGLRPGPMMASSDEFEITVTGHGAHAALPYTGIDPIVTGAALVQALQTIVSRNINAVDAAVVTVTQFHGGDAWNVIPPDAVLRGTARAFRPEIQDLIESSMRRICDGIAAAHGAKVHVHYKRNYPPTINAPRETEISAQVLEQMVGAANVKRDLEPTMGAEDFAYMLQAKPGCYIFVGNGPGEGGCMLHNPRYDFNDQVLPIGASYWVRLVEHLLPKS